VSNDELIAQVQAIRPEALTLRAGFYKRTRFKKHFVASDILGLEIHQHRVSEHPLPHIYIGKDRIAAMGEPAEVDIIVLPRFPQ